MLAKAALGGIWIYQNYLSPRKGFRCAYAVQHGGTGCSGYAKHVVRDHGALAAIPLVRARFRACKVAAITLADQREDANRKYKKQSKSGKCSDCACAGADAATFCGGGARAAGAKKGACDIGPGGCDGPGPCDIGCDACSCS